MATQPDCCDRCGSALVELEVDHSGDRRCCSCGHAMYKRVGKDDGGHARAPIETRAFYDRERAARELAGEPEQLALELGGVA
jgi:uncharacterized Zn finger protein (UPF0148 family)